MCANRAQLPTEGADENSATRRCAGAPDVASGAVESARGPLDGAGLATLLVALLRAVLRRGYDRVPARFVNATISVCGLFMLISPLLLWIAWSAGIALVLWTMIGVCFLVICVIAWVAPGEPF